MDDYLQYYLLERHRSEAFEYLRTLQGDFSVRREKAVLLHPFFFGLYATYAEQIVTFFQRDICFAAVHLLVIARHQSEYSDTAAGFYMDSVVQKIVSCWEYVFQTLNQFWGIELLSSTHSRELLAEIYQKRWETVQTAEGFELRCSDYSEDKLREINDWIRQAFVVLHANRFQKQVKKTGRFALIPELDELMALYNSADCKKLRTELRNEMTHGASTAFRMRVGGVNAVLPHEGITVHTPPAQREEFIQLVSNNIRILQNGIQILKNTIWNNAIPNSKGNEGKCFYAAALRCRNCGFEDSIAQENLELFRRHMQGRAFLCPTCKSNLTVTDRLPLPESDYNTLLFHIKHFEQQLQWYVKSNDASSGESEKGR